VATWITRFDTSGPGLRVAVKDLIDMAGVPTTNGSMIVAPSAGHRDVTADAVCLTGTRAAESEGRARIVGKTNLHELAFGVSGINPWYGTPVNPLDPDLVPGGSSSGSATAVAAGEADVAYGSDTGGSIRIPAACCGAVGLKTTRRRIPLDGVRPLAPSLDTVGPLGATVEAVAIGMALLEPGFRTEGVASVSRVGRFRPVATPEVDEAIDRALAATGLEVVGIELPGWDQATRATMTILAAEAWQVHADLWHKHAGELSPDVAARLEASSLISRSEVAAAWEDARDWSTQLSSVFAHVPLIVLPTLGDEPPSLEDAARLTDIRYVAPFNLAGQPALSMPVPGGGPVPPSLQLAGPAGSEAWILATAGRIEEAVGPRSEWTASDRV
jgi:amidase